MPWKTLCSSRFPGPNYGAICFHFNSVSWHQSSVSVNIGLPFFVYLDLIISLLQRTGKSCTGFKYDDCFSCLGSIMQSNNISIPGATTLLLPAGSGGAGNQGIYMVSLFVNMGDKVVHLLFHFSLFS